MFLGNKKTTQLYARWLESNLILIGTSFTESKSELATMRYFLISLTNSCAYDDVVLR